MAVAVVSIVKVVTSLKKRKTNKGKRKKGDKFSFFSLVHQPPQILALLVERNVESNHIRPLKYKRGLIIAGTNGIVITIVTALLQAIYLSS